LSIKNKSQKEITQQYLSKLLTSMNRCDSAEFKNYQTALKNPRLVKLLLGIAYDKKRLLSDLLEELCIAQLKRDKVYRDYFDSGKQVEIKQKHMLHIFTPRRMALQLERGGGTK
jgi:hypothetical protein